MIRIPYTNYGFTPPAEPLTKEQYDDLRHLSDSQFRMQLKQAKKIAGREGWSEFFDSWKILLMAMASCALLSWIFSLLEKYSVVFEWISGLFLIFLILAFFGVLYSSALSISSNVTFVYVLGRFLKKQRSEVLISLTYSDYISSYYQIKK
jgi:hypothetical protein